MKFSNEVQSARPSVGFVESGAAEDAIQFSAQSKCFPYFSAF